MNSRVECVKIKTNPGWVICPICKKKRLLRVLHNTEVKNLPVYCKKCEKKLILNISPNEEPVL